MCYWGKTREVWGSFEVPLCESINLIGYDTTLQSSLPKFEKKLTESKFK